MGIGRRLNPKRAAKAAVMNATHESLVGDLERIRAEIAELTRAVAALDGATGQVRRDLASAAGDLAVLREEVSRHLPRPGTRPEFLSQFHISDALAWRAADSSARWAEQHLLRAEVLPSREAHIRHSAQAAPAEGMILEFGVGAGESLRWLQDCAAGRPVYGFDSFEGLPEAWRTGFGAGAFGDVEIPELEHARLVPGWFEETVGPFLAEHPEPISLLHVDCDLYSSALTVLTACVPRLTPGAVVVFDEFLNYPGWQEHEARAWAEVVDSHGLQVEYLGYVPSWEQVSAVVRSGAG